MISPDDFKKLRHYCYQNYIQFFPDDDESKKHGVQSLSLKCLQTGDWYPECETIQQARLTVLEIRDARQRRPKMGGVEGAARAISAKPPPSSG